MENKYNAFLYPVARVLLSFIFIMSGVGKMGDWSGTAGYMASHGFFAVPFFLAGAIFLEIAGGLSVLTGFKARWGALALIVFLVPATLIFHAFWTLPAESMRMEMISFLKNISILGGLLFVLANGAGSFSVDNRLSASGRK
ncbi:MAG TPA: DoxX family protein [Candidatus Hydrogenedentes bacterium]|nr:DoxX family protein [Candidatus Hydrogenedentota bacterium]HRK36540.1 DoxX family protein [Candidatus Hydrogenedentota bacterium]